MPSGSLPEMFISTIAVAPSCCMALIFRTCWSGSDEIRPIILKVVSETSRPFAWISAGS
jgi:hypothetical protein